MCKRMAIALLLSVVAIHSASAQTSVWTSSGFCWAGSECSFDVWVATGAPIGRLAVVIHYDNARMLVTSIDNHAAFPVTQRLWYADDICAHTTVCPAPGSCGQIDYLGLDASNGTSGTRKLLTVHYTLSATTAPSWNPCDGWCNQYICVALTPFSGDYDGSNRLSMNFTGGTLTYSSTPPPDTDGDGLIDPVELMLGTDPQDADSDDDGLFDGVDPTVKGRKGAGFGEDEDLDGVISPWETDPADPDSDDDGLFDGTESGLTAARTPDTDLGAGTFVADADPGSNTDPRDPDSDDDGALDGVEDANGNGAVDPGEADPLSDASVPTLEAPDSGIQVLLLGDSGSTSQVQTALQDAGHVVTVVDPHYDWDGMTPPPTSFGVVVLLDGDDYGSALDTAADTALYDFVTAGGGLVVTEWTAYDVCYGDKAGAWTGLLPVSSAPDCEYDYGATWNRQGNHELTQGLPASWTEADEGVSTVEAMPGTLVVARSEVGVPLLAYGNQSQGRVVHVNNSLTYSSGTIDPHVLTAIVNAVGYANRKLELVFSDGFESGAVSSGQSSS